MPAPRLHKGCDQCQALKRVLEERERLYMNAKMRFNAASASMDSGSFSRARSQVQDAREDFEIAKIEFDRHQQTHTVAQSGLGRASGSGSQDS